MLIAPAISADGAAQAPSRPWRMSAEGGPLYAQARGTLATYLSGGYGFGARIHAAPAGSSLGLRVDGEFLTFGEQTRMLPYNGSGPDIAITTGSRIFLATAGPELRREWHRLGFAVGAGAGMAYFSNTGAVDGWGDPDRFQRANSYGHVTWALRGGAGANLRLGRSPRSARLEFGAQVVQAGASPYLREYNLPVGVISGIYLYPTPFRPSFVVCSVGVSAGV
jgi:hypothetical protein